jgi:hypothetical protein
MANACWRPTQAPASIHSLGVSINGLFLRRSERKYGQALLKTKRLAVRVRSDLSESLHPLHLDYYPRGCKNRPVWGGDLGVNHGIRMGYEKRKKL